jgi:hypothetical protein
MEAIAIAAGSWSIATALDDTKGKSRQEQLPYDNNVYAC